MNNCFFLSIISILTDIIIIIDIFNLFFITQKCGSKPIKWLVTSVQLQVGLLVSIGLRACLANDGRTIILFYR